MASTHVQEIEQLNRLYSALTRISQAIVRTQHRDQLVSSVCKILVEQGGFGMAWIGWHDPATRRLVPLAQAGDETGYLQRIQVYADDRPEGRGPPGRAFRSNRPYICLDLFADACTVPWRAELERSGFKAAAAFPIQANGTPAGTLTVLTARQGAFRDEEIALLAQAAADISFALDNRAREEARQRAEAMALRFAAIVESTDDAVISTTIDGVITSWNPAAARLFGYAEDEMLGRSVHTTVPRDRLGETQMILQRIRHGQHIKQFETIRQRKDGTRLPVSITVSPIRGHEDTSTDQIAEVAATIRDISERKRSEAIAEREQRFANSLIEAMPGIFYLYDEQGRFLRWNSNFEKVSGYSGEEIAKLQPIDFFNPDFKGLVQQRIAEAFEKGEATVEAPFLCKSGKTIPYFFTGKRITLEGAASVVGVGVDIAERWRAEDTVRKSEERYRTTLDTMLEGCQLLGFDWRYLYLNAAAAIHNRRPNADLLGRTMPEAWPGIEQTEVFAMLRRCMEGRVPVQSEVDFVFADGSSAWFDVRAQPVPEGIFVLSIEISERKAAERALRELNEQLERKVAQRTLDLEIARERAEAADQLKSAFLATMSHELRTPLNSILGFTGIVLKGMAGPLSAEQSKQLGMVQGSARHLLALINDVLDISKIEAGQLEVRRAPFDLRSSLERVAASVLPLAEKKGLTLVASVPEATGILSSDQRRVEQILLNLLNNAIKFTDRGGVTLGVELFESGDPTGTAERQRGVRLRVSDTGIGIKPEDLSKLFQPFRQLDSGLQRQHDGTGLGLAICQRLTGLLGGTILVESEPGQGSTFTVVLPMQRSDVS